MDRALFSVGEEVIIQSRMRPESNGPTTVTIVWDKSSYTISDGGVSCRCPAKYSYSLAIDISDDEVWCQCTLRKKPDGSGITSVEDIKKTLGAPLKSPLLEDLAYALNPNALEDEGEGEDNE